MMKASALILLLVLPLSAQYNPFRAKKQAKNRKSSQVEMLPDSRLAKRAQLASDAEEDAGRARTEARRQRDWAREEARHVHKAEQLKARAESLKQEIQALLKEAEAEKKEAEAVRRDADASWKTFESTRRHTAPRKEASPAKPEAAKKAAAESKSEPKAEPKAEPVKVADPEKAQESEKKAE